MNFGTVSLKQPWASSGSKQKEREPRDLRFAQNIRAILDRVRFLGQFAVGAALEAPYHQPPRIQRGTPAPWFLMQVEGLGELDWPIDPDEAAELKPLCQQAPHGRGEATVVDTAVRNTLQLSPDKFSVPQTPSWLTTLAKIVGDAQKELGVAGDVEAQLYKMLLYEKGSFFVPHRDTEKAPGMFGSLIVLLPGDHSGGDLVISHGGSTKSYGKAQLGGGLSYVAFFASCTHEVTPVTEGHRLCLVYNLVQLRLTLQQDPQQVYYARRSPRPPPDVPGYGPLAERLGAALAQWKQHKQCAERLVYMLEHRYTQENSHGIASLKGADKLRAQLVQEAAERTGGIGAAVVTVTKTEMGDAEEPGWRGGGYNMGEVLETEWAMEQLFHVAGDQPDDSILTKEPWRLDECTLQENPFKDLDPDDEDCEGPTGNEGCPMTRWYRHAALLLWTYDEEEEGDAADDVEVVDQEIICIDVRSPPKQKRRR